MRKRIAIIGGGPSGLFMFKRLIESGDDNISVDIFESQAEIGAGMPYGRRGANEEHVTNVSGNEIPVIVTPLKDWLESLPVETLDTYKLRVDSVIDYKVIPRLLFGQYLSSQFELLNNMASDKGIETIFHLETTVTDIKDLPSESRVVVSIGTTTLKFDHIIVCTGHLWPKTFEGTVPGYYDSPYPPLKLKKHSNHRVAIRGSSLTAIDAIRTLARYNGTFVEESPHKVIYRVSDDAKDFMIILHSRSGLLPGIRFHLDDPHLSKDSLLSEEELAEHIESNDGYLSLDFIFEKDFKDVFKEKDKGFYDLIKNLSLEEFVAAMMDYRKGKEPFDLFLEEYAEAMQSIRNKESVYWKEMLAVLSFAMNYPAKHLSAEDMIRLQKTLMPLISIVIAFAPQNSCEELIALHNAGRLEIVAVGDAGDISIAAEGGIHYTFNDGNGITKTEHYKTFIDCIGQKHLSINEFPFPSLVDDDVLQPAKIKFRSPVRGMEESKTNNKVRKDASDNYFLDVPGISISDSFRVVDKSGWPHERIHIMAVPYIGGYNPDYSGLDFCEEASRIIAEDIVKTSKQVL